MPGTGRWKPENIFIAEKTHWGLKLQDVLDSEESDHVDWFRRDDAGPSSFIGHEIQTCDWDFWWIGKLSNIFHLGSHVFLR